MKKRLLILVGLISGCVGDQLEFRFVGSTYQKKQGVICINWK